VETDVFAQQVALVRRTSRRIEATEIVDTSWEGVIHSDMLGVCARVRVVGGHLGAQIE
jgi:hypothetical protein